MVCLIGKQIETKNKKEFVIVKKQKLKVSWWRGLRVSHNIHNVKWSNFKWKGKASVENIWTAEFKATTGWFWRWKNYVLTSIKKIHREAKEANAKVANNWMRKIFPFLTEIYDLVAFLGVTKQCFFVLCQIHVYYCTFMEKKQLMELYCKPSWRKIYCNYGYKILG